MHVIQSGRNKSVRTKPWITFELGLQLYEQLPLLELHFYSFRMMLSGCNRWLNHENLLKTQVTSEVFQVVSNVF